MEIIDDTEAFETILGEVEKLQSSARSLNTKIGKVVDLIGEYLPEEPDAFRKGKKFYCNYEDDGEPMNAFDIMEHLRIEHEVEFDDAIVDGWRDSDTEKYDRFFEKAEKAKESKNDKKVKKKGKKTKK